MCAFIAMVSGWNDIWLSSSVPESTQRVGEVFRSDEGEGAGSCCKLQNMFQSLRFTNSLNYINFESVDGGSSLSALYSLIVYKAQRPK
jgi:hypothetical protein